jgi:hypothetical protein
MRSASPSILVMDDDEESCRNPSDIFTGLLALLRQAPPRL